MVLFFVCVFVFFLRGMIPGRKNNHAMEKIIGGKFKEIKITIVIFGIKEYYIIGLRIQ